MKIGIIGTGKVGIATGYVIKKNGLPIGAVSDRADSALTTARAYLGDTILYTKDNMEVLDTCDVIAITTQDGMIREVVQEIDGKAPDLEGKLFFHTSGAHPSSVLSPLDKRGALLGSLHPLQTFPDIDSAISVLPETYIFIEGGEKALETLRVLGSHLGCKVVTIDGTNKVLYHLSAVFVCNLLCALLYGGEGIMKKIHIDLEPFFPIVRATLKNIETKGPLTSLTGPVIRGDAETVASHIDAMADMEKHRHVYKTLSLVALDMVKERNILSEDALSRMKKTLEDIK
jgi:predicted short-subunit dehydrogenase-like oxidoreductase (DUF2520 family)